jgi:superfamily II DNA/RNA helicase
MPRPLAADFSAVHTFPSVLDTESPAAPKTREGIEDANRTPKNEPADNEPARRGIGKPTDVTFGDLGVPARLVTALSAAGITTPFPIQTATIPDALAGRDVLGRGQTGSGKTLAFGLPMLATLAAGKKSKPHRPRGLILVPTRELAMQVADALAPLGRSLGVHLQTAVGGVRYDRQMQALQRGVDIMVATPGRLGDLIERGACALDDIVVTVLDEADQMADMGFLPDVTGLLMLTPEKSQRLLFSATLDNDVDTLVEKFLTDPVTHEVDPPKAAVTTMEHQLLLIPATEKFPITAAIANRAGRTIMFAKTQMGVDRLVDQLLSVGVRTSGLHGGKTQAVRTRTLAEFREGRMDVLVATDVAARGIHVDGISLVVHIDPPKDSKDYLHRAGRTARAGETGTVVTLVLPRQRRTVFGMVERAGVAATRTETRLNSPALVEVTGARTPSGEPVTMGSWQRDERPRRDGRSRREDGSVGFRSGSTKGRAFGGDRGDRRDRTGESSRQYRRDATAEPRRWPDAPTEPRQPRQPWRDGADDSRQPRQPRRSGAGDSPQPRQENRSRADDSRQPRWRGGAEGSQQPQREWRAPGGRESFGRTEPRATWRDRTDERAAGRDRPDQGSTDTRRARPDWHSGARDSRVEPHYGGTRKLRAELSDRKPAAGKRNRDFA